MTAVTYDSIGVVHSPFKEPKDMPIQPVGCKGVKGTVEIFPQYVGGLADLEGFAYIMLVCHLNLAKPYALTVKPFLDDKVHGVFATRAPSRPNPIGISTVRLNRIEGERLFIEDLDIVDGTPLLDIKPFIPAFDNRRTRKVGWFRGKAAEISSTKNDGRFSK